VRLRDWLSARRQKKLQHQRDHVLRLLQCDPSRRWYIDGRLEYITGLPADQLHRILEGLERQGLVVSGWQHVPADPVRRQFWLAAQSAARSGRTGMNSLSR
jgi:hypothetical protein